MMDKLPINWKCLPSKCYGDGYIGTSKNTDPHTPMIGLLLHTDTVHKPNSGLETKIVGNKLFGQGAMDMQSSLFVVAEILKQLENANLLENIVVILNTQEEIGSPGFQDEFGEIAKKLDYVMVFEPSGFGEKKPKENGFEREFALVTERKGIFMQIIGVLGPGGHSGTLTTRNERKNAISHAAQVITAVDNLADFDAGTTINVEYINGGKHNTVIAESCEFGFDARFRYETERQRLKESIAKILKTPYIPGVEVVNKGFFYDLPSWQPNENTEAFFTLAQKAGTEIGISIVREKRGGWCDACNFFSYNPNLKILDGFGPKGEGEHSDTEFVYLNTIEPSIQLSTAVIKKILEK